jgi:hypothetical protein
MPLASTKEIFDWFTEYYVACGITIKIPKGGVSEHR